MNNDVGGLISGEKLVERDVVPCEKSLCFVARVRYLLLGDAEAELFISVVGEDVTSELVGRTVRREDEIEASVGQIELHERDIPLFSERQDYF